MSFALELQAHFLGWRLLRFGKELYTYVPLSHLLRMLGVTPI